MQEDNEIICYCPECGAKHMTVRPGKTQPSCDCDNICVCGNRIEYHCEENEKWPNFFGYYCSKCGPFGPDHEI